VAAVGLLESLMTAQIIDDLTDTDSDKNRECVGQGIANTATGFIGGMAGCAMIGQSMINVKSGGRGRLSTFAAGVFLLILIVGLGDWVAQIPMPALVAIMIMVSIGTFSWSSIREIRYHPRSSTIVMLATVAATVFTHNLAIGVLTGVLLSGIFLKSFDFHEALDRVVIDVSHAHIWDISAVGALDKAVLKFRREGAEVDIVGLNEASETIVDKLAIHDKPDAIERLFGH